MVVFATPPFWLAKAMTLAWPITEGSDALGEIPLAPRYSQDYRCYSFPYAAGVRAEVLLDKRLIFVTGKGGVGKSTVAAALGSPRRGAGGARSSPSVAARTASRGRSTARTAGFTEDGDRATACTTISIDPQHALEEYLRDADPGEARWPTCCRAAAMFTYFAAATPGMRELRDDRQGLGAGAARAAHARAPRRYDLVIVDAPATGHGARHAARPADLRRDRPRRADRPPGPHDRRTLTRPARTPASSRSRSPEEMPVNETLDAARAAAARAGHGARRGSSSTASTRSASGRVSARTIGDARWTTAGTRRSRGPRCARRCPSTPAPRAPARAARAAARRARPRAGRSCRSCSQPRARPATRSSRARRRAGGGACERRRRCCAGKRVVHLRRLRRRGQDDDVGRDRHGHGRRGRKVAVVTIDPAKRLANSLGLEELGNEPRARRPGARSPAHGLEMKGELWAMMLDAKRTFDELIERLAPDEQTRDEILANRIYQELSNAVAGSQEYTAMAQALRARPRRALRPARARHAALAQRAGLPRRARPPDRVPRGPRAAGVPAPDRPRGRASSAAARACVFSVLKRVTGVDLLQDLVACSSARSAG